ncbi:MAG: hypothetical protein M3Y59_20355 [Myxococcota bacterium]|nr:hypothetical protein [Myxococcota bacterium]
MNRWLKAVGVVAAASLLATGCMNRARTEEGTGGSGTDETQPSNEGINAGPDDGMGGAGQEPPATWDEEGTGGSGTEEFPPMPEDDMGTEEETTVPMPEDDMGTGGSGTIDEEGAVEPGLDDPELEEMPPVPDEDSDY